MVDAFHEEMVIKIDEFRAKNAPLVICDALKYFLINFRGFCENNLFIIKWAHYIGAQFFNQFLIGLI
jgi:hypothetical protein